MNAKYSDDCLFCGARLPWATPVDSPGSGLAGARVVLPDHVVDNSTGKYRNNDKPEAWVALLSFFLPPAGLALYIHYTGHSPLRAKSALKGMWAGVAVWIVLILLLPGPATPPPTPVVPTQ